MKKAVIYTSLTGGYDNLPQYEVLDADFDYICFTNDYPAGSKVGQWEIRPIPIVLDDKTRLSRYVKLMPHAVFPDYEYSVWLDANLIITAQNIYDIIKQRINHKEIWCAVKHPLLDCIYDDAHACIIGANVKFSDVAPQVKFLQQEKFPRHYGLYENNFIIRNHNAFSVKEIDSTWWEIYLQYSKRDQLSLCYIFWKKNFTPTLIFPPEFSTRNVTGMKYKPHLIPSIQFRIKHKIRKYYNQFKLLSNKIFDQ